MSEYYLELGPEFKTAWDDRKFLVFKNGYLLSKQTYNIIIPSPQNEYLRKILYTTVPFDAGDRIEVFYIENEENFANVPFNRETRLTSYIYYAKMDNQKLIKIPYPNSSYRRSKDSFLLFNEEREHLDYRYDYTVSVDGRYVTLADHEVLKETMVNYVVFTFCYVENKSINDQEEEPDPMDVTTLAEVNYTYSYSISNISNTTGKVQFDPPFTGYPNMKKEHFMLFGNSVFIDPKRYEITSNNTIQFTEQSDVEIANLRRYTMCIPVHETKLGKNADNQIIFEAIRIEATEDWQSIFKLKLPSDATEWYPFLIFRGSRLMDNKNEYLYDDVTNILTISDSSCYIKKGRHLTIIYLNKSYTDIVREVSYVKMQFDANQTGMTEIPSELYNNSNLVFDEKNLLLFINGTFLEPERYSIESGNWIKFNPDPEVSGYEEPYREKTFAAVYLFSYPDYDVNYGNYNDTYSQKEIDPSEDNDKTRFDVLYSKVERKP